VVAAIVARIEAWQKELENDKVRGVALAMRRALTTKGTKEHKGNAMRKRSAFSGQRSAKRMVKA